MLEWLWWWFFFCWTSAGFVILKLRLSASTLCTITWFYSQWWILICRTSLWQPHSYAPSEHYAVSNISVLFPIPKKFLKKRSLVACNPCNLLGSWGAKLELRQHQFIFEFFKIKSSLFLNISFWMGRESFCVHALFMGSHYASLCIWLGTMVTSRWWHYVGSRWNFDLQYHPRSCCC